MLDIITASSSASDIGNEISNWLGDDGSALIVSRAAGLFMFALMFFLACCFFPTACPCCTRCRACRPKDGPRNSPLVAKAAGLALAAAVAFGVAT